MEFDTNSQDRSSDISDEMRLEASSRQATIAPIHDDLAPDEKSDELVATEHILASPIANIPTDSESTTAYIQTISDRKVHHFALTVSISVAAVLTGVVAYFVFA
jgi:hypothetical protein